MILVAASSSVARLADVIPDFDGSDGYPLPAKLSATNLYEGIGAQSRKVTEGIIPFEINSPLWSDGARKERYIALPAGTSIVPTDTAKYHLPDKTVFIKSFKIDTVYGDTSSGILVETRFLVYREPKDPDENPWHGISYHWARDQSDAFLVDQNVGENVVHNVWMNGTLRGKRWTNPSKDQCITCHFNRGVLGFITPQLNRPSKTNSAVNQLQELADKGVLTFNPVAGKPDAVRWAAVSDTGATLELRARSYFASNCSHCHGSANSPANHNFDLFHPEFNIDQGPGGDNGAYVGKITHQGGDHFPQFIYKGYPESSYVLKRMMVRQDFNFVPTEQMPTLATFQIDSSGLNLLKTWICSLGNRPADVCKLPQILPDSFYWDEATAVRGSFHRGVSASAERPLLRNGSLWVTPASLAPGSPPGLYDIHGRMLALFRIGGSEYRILSPMRPGIYFVKTAVGLTAIRSL
jgi:hypothetical protein